MMEMTMTTRRLLAISYTKKQKCEYVNDNIVLILKPTLIALQGAHINDIVYS